MSALILKDFYVLWRQMRLFLLLLLVFSAIPGSFNSTFVVVYAAMLPYTAMAYDERSKWNQLAAMLPYSRRDIVLGKYVFGWIVSAAAAVASLILQLIVSVFFHFGHVVPMGSVLAFFASLCILAVTLPLMFRFGVEKGRLVMFLIIFLICGTAGAMGGIVEELSTDGQIPLSLAAALPMAAAVLTGLSIPLSIRLYRRRDD